MEPSTPPDDARCERPILERDLQAYLAKNLDALGEHLKFVATEHILPIGRVDILARDRGNSLVAIELKIGPVTRDAVGQLQSYMGALGKEGAPWSVRGILVGAALDEGARSALSVARDITFVQYSIAFQFAQTHSSPRSEQIREIRRLAGIKKVFEPRNFRR